MREYFRCDRVSADHKATDVYCNKPSLYFEDLKNGNVINAGDFDSPRYKNFYKRSQ